MLMLCDVIWIKPDIKAVVAWIEIGYTFGGLIDKSKLTLKSKTFSLALDIPWSILES